MKARRLAPAIGIALSALILAWGAVSSLSAQDYGDSTGTKKSSKHMSKTSRETGSMSSSKSSGKIIDKLGGMSAIDALTDRFLTGIMGGTSSWSTMGNNGNAPMSSNMGNTGNMRNMGNNVPPAGESGIGQTGVSGSGMGVDTMGNTGLPPHATGDTTGRMTPPSPGVSGTTGSTGNYGTTGTVGDTGTMGNRNMGTMGNTGTMGNSNMGNMGNTGYSGTGMGTATNMGGWDYTAIREHVRTKLCKAAGGDCKVAKLTKSEQKNQPPVSEGQWDAAVNDMKTALASYNLTSSDQDKLVSAVTGMRKEFVRGNMGMNQGSGSNSMDTGTGKHSGRHHRGSSGTSGNPAPMGTDTTGRGGMK